MPNTWRVAHTWMDTAALGTPDLSIYQPFSAQQNCLIEMIRTWVVFDTLSTSLAMTDLRLRIYSNNVAGGNVPEYQLAESTSIWTKTQLITMPDATTLQYGVVGVPFRFSDFPARASDTYHLVLKASGYTGSDTSHLSWRRGYPDPTYRGNLTMTFENQLRYPRMVSFFGKLL